MNGQRPDPDQLLARVQAEETRAQQGKLKIFFGAAAGVGKTYTMLEAARAQQAAGVRVLVGYVELHGRQETEALLDGLEQLPLRQMAYQDRSFKEFDLEQALALHPELILVDEFAHTNAPGSRHPKRWQDIEELLQAGINVYTTVNVQHLESLNDVVAQITGVVVRETIPDTLFALADEVELVDLPPDNLLQRLKDGKIYLPAQAQNALTNFFRKGNLIALRELALRRTAERVEAQMQDYRRDNAITQTWPAGEKILVCVGPSPLSARLIRTTCRMASRLPADWIAVYVETPQSANLPAPDRQRVTQNLRLAEQLGAQTMTLTGQKISEELLLYARRTNASKIVIGKPAGSSRWKELLFGSLVDDLVRSSGEIDLYVINGDTSTEREAIPTPKAAPIDWAAYGWSVLVVAGCTAVARLIFPYFDAANLVMLYLLGVVGVASRFGRGASILASVLSVIAFDFFCVPPYYSFAVADTQYLVTFGVLLVVALVISRLTVRTRQQAEAARQRERRTASLYAMSRDLASARGREDLVAITLRQIKEVFGGDPVILLPDAQGSLTAASTLSQPDHNEIGVAQWVLDRGAMAGQGTNTLPGAKGLYLPLQVSQKTLGVVGIFMDEPLAPEPLHLLETFVSQTAIALERDQLANQAQQAQVQVQTEQLRNTLLSSVSHDLRTPLAVITGASSSLLATEPTTSSRYELLETIYEESDHLNRLVRNLLDMTRLEGGTIILNREWQPLEEVIGAALSRLEKSLHQHILTTQLPPDLPLVCIDSLLITQVLINLLENALKYTPAQSAIEISALFDHNAITVTLQDNGPGLIAGHEEQIFEKFYRAQPAGLATGVGLGLTICRAIIEAHGGKIWAENNVLGGARFCFTLPITEPPPLPQAEEAIPRDTPL